MLLAIIAILAACAAVVLIRPAPEPLTDAVAPDPQPVTAERDPVV